MFHSNILLRKREFPVFDKILFLYSIITVALPLFPNFKPLELNDREYIRDVIRDYDPIVSEMTCTNLFIWRDYYGFIWSICDGTLFIVSREGPNGTYALEPIGTSANEDSVMCLLRWLRDELRETNPQIQRADTRCISILKNVENILIEPMREHFDYVYRKSDLVELEGSKYRSKRNHINQLLRNHVFQYDSLDDRYIQDCLSLQEKWCQLNRCDDDLDLLGENGAVTEVLTHFRDLDVDGAVIVIQGKVKAFTVGERLNENTQVIHIEKADPEITGLYQLINHEYCKNMSEEIEFINREQDLGIEGLRKAKLSYHPDRFIEKNCITLK